MRAGTLQIHSSGWARFSRVSFLRKHGVRDGEVVAKGGTLLEL